MGCSSGDMVGWQWSGGNGECEWTMLGQGRNLNTRRWGEERGAPVGRRAGNLHGVGVQRAQGGGSRIQQPWKPEAPSSGVGEP